MRKSLRLNNVLLFLVMVLIGLPNLQAQSVEFAPVGAEWYYGKYFREGVNPTGNTYDYFKSLREVEVNGWMCKEVEKSWHSDCNGNYNPQTEIHYLCQEGEQVYEVENGERFLLYDFSKNVGDFWVMPKYEDTVFVDEITSITLSDGSQRRIFHISALHEGEQWLYDSIMEGMGMFQSIFPIPAMTGSFVYESVRCYFENDIQLISSELACDDEDPLSVEENDETKRISTFPNPVKNQFQMQLPTGAECSLVQLYNLQGRLVSTQNSGFENISTEQLAKGTYLVKVTLADGKVITEKIVKE